VNTDVTVPAIRDILTELEGMRDRPVIEAELHAARDFLVGVFPLRFETPAAVVGAISSIVIHGLPDDELARYRPALEAVSAADVTAAARDHIHPDEAAILLVGDASAFLPDLEAAGLGAITVEREAAELEAVEGPDAT
jgi:predicted Zn-dependent peptidase